MKLEKTSGILSMASLLAMQPMGYVILYASFIFYFLLVITSLDWNIIVNQYLTMEKLMH